ncbi:hypothetical protein C5167_040560 [Papaver somniferum]|uniref:Uncharacterized protein n=1 Tax=Papaver somniferum TaxID=3469 RepID=A0A4Y7IHR5_PAPSO|nr:hypothetical protein C5167_040560 [Papaver somniferum]
MIFPLNNSQLREEVVISLEGKISPLPIKDRDGNYNQRVECIVFVAGDTQPQSEAFYGMVQLLNEAKKRCKAVLAERGMGIMCTEQELDQTAAAIAFGLGKYVPRPPPHPIHKTFKDHPGTMISPLRNKVGYDYRRSIQKNQEDNDISPLPTVLLKYPILLACGPVKRQETLQCLVNVLGSIDALQFLLLLETTGELLNFKLERFRCLNRGTPTDPKAEDKASGKSQKISVTDDKRRVIKRLLKEAEDFAEEDTKVLKDD